MATRQKVTDEEVRRAIYEWQGHVAAAADSLRINRRTLTKRLDRLGISAEALRKGVDSRPPSRPTDPNGAPEVRAVGTLGARGARDTLATHDSLAAIPEAPRVAGAPKEKIRAVFSDEKTRPTLEGMEGAEIADVLATASKPKPPRFPPAISDWIAVVRRELSALYNRDFSADEINAWFYRDRFEEWAAEKKRSNEDEPGESE